MSANINIGDFLTTRARLNPNKEALYDVLADRRFTFRELNTRANKVCGALLSMGLSKGDRVAVLTYNGHEYMECFFGPAKAGIVVMPLNWRLTAEELSFILADGGATALIFDTDFLPVVEQIRTKGEASSDLKHWVEISGNNAEFAAPYEDWLGVESAEEPQHKAEGDDNLFIMYTSGTTGLPKGVVHTHSTQLWAVLTGTNTSDMHFTDRYLVLLPLFHVGALTPMITGLYKGNSQVILRNFDPEKTWQLIEQEKIASTLAVPAMLGFMTQVPGFEKYDWSSIRWIMSGAAPLPVATINTYKELGIEIHQVYGLTESCGPACLIGPEDAMRKIGSTGKAFFHSEVRIVDEDGADMPVGHAGEVIVRGAHIMKEYWNRPDATAEVVRDGWLYSGDIAVMDEEGFVTIQDRMKDMIISGGENVYPAEIENVLLQHPDILDAAVIGLDSPKWGESPFAIIVSSSDSLSEAAVLAHCDGKLARFKLPKGVAMIDVIPRNPSGKILKRLLREQFPGPAAD